MIQSGLPTAAAALLLLLLVLVPGTYYDGSKVSYYDSVLYDTACRFTYHDYCTIENPRIRPLVVISRHYYFCMI